MSVLNKALDFLGFEVEEEEELQRTTTGGVQKEDLSAFDVTPAILNQKNNNKQQTQGKVVNIHTQQQFKVVVMNPENFEDAREITEHLKNKKPVVINLIEIEKEFAQRILDFLSGAVCSLDGSIQKVAQGIFVVAPNNVDIMGEFKDELRNKSALFPWVRG
jgi:cell division inhibitor SepF